MVEAVGDSIRLTVPPGSGLRAPGFSTLASRYGRPEAEAIPLAHEQAAFAAQDHAAWPSFLPALPLPEAAASRLPVLRVLRRPRGSDAAGPRLRRVAAP